MTPEEEIDVEIARSIINEHIAKLSRRWSVERACGNSEGSEKAKKAIWNARVVLYNLTTEEARRVIEDNEMNNVPRKIELASQELCDEYSQEIDELLLCLGHPEALVTDLSSLGDFLSVYETCEGARGVLDLLEKTFGEQQTLNLTDRLVDLARAIRRERDGRR